MSDTVLVHENNGVLTLTMNRPERRNALDIATYLRLAELVRAASAAKQQRAIVLTGANNYFTAGNDLKDFQAPRSSGDSAGLTFLRSLIDCDLPIIAAVEGRAIGIGVTMLLHCDLVYVAEDAKLSAPFVNLALVPEAASSILLTSRIGHAQAFAMFVLGEPITGLTAVANGLATAAVPAAEVYARALAAAKAVAKRPPGSVKATKMLMRDVEMIQARMKVEGEIFSARLKTAEAAEAFQAFAERRQPDFSKL